VAILRKNKRKTFYKLNQQSQFVKVEKKIDWNLEKNKKLEVMTISSIVSSQRIRISWERKIQVEKREWNKVDLMLQLFKVKMKVLVLAQF